MSHQNDVINELKNEIIQLKKTIEELRLEIPRLVRFGILSSLKSPQNIKYKNKKPQTSNDEVDIMESSDDEFFEDELMAELMK